MNEYAPIADSAPVTTDGNTPIITTRAAGGAVPIVDDDDQATEVQAEAARTPRRGQFTWRTPLALALAAVVLFCVYAKGRGWKTWLIGQVFPSYKTVDRPHVTRTRPADHANNIPADAFVAADVELPNAGNVIDPETLRPDTVRLYRTRDRLAVEARIGTTAAGDVITLKPNKPLEANTLYTFEVNPGVQDTAGAAFNYFTSQFTTAPAVKPSSYPVAFDKVELPQTAGEVFTTVAVGPDRRLYAGTFDGRILRYPIHDDGTLGAVRTITSIQKGNDGPRLVTGIAFDPSSSSEHLVLWVSHGLLAMEGAEDWTGKIGRLSGADLAYYEDVVVHLPRAVKDHLNNQLCFGPDGALYFPQASNTAMGAPDEKWAFRPERLMTASILRLDVSRLGRGVRLPLDVKTEEGGTYHPFAPGAPLTIYASGVRNGFDLVWHSNGNLYVPLNGSSAGGNTPATPQDPEKFRRRLDTPGSKYEGPAVPAVERAEEVMDDLLLRVEKGGYYGHPNPERSEYVLAGGNPTDGPDPGEIAAYPVGTLPDRNWRAAGAFVFGKNLSPNGIIEYRNADAFGGMLRGKLLVCRYSGGDDVIVLTPAGPGAEVPEGDILESVTGIDGLTDLADPLDLVEDPATGMIYVVEFDAKRITLLRPAGGRRSRHVYRMSAVNATVEASARW